MNASPILARDCGEILHIASQVHVLIPLSGAPIQHIIFSGLGDMRALAKKPHHQHK